MPQLRSFRFQSLFRDAIHVVDAQGRPLVSDPPFARPPAIDWEHFEARVGVTGLVPAAAPRDARPVLAMVVPFERAGKPYYLVGEMKPRGSTLSVYLQNLATEPDFHVVLVDASARVIAAPDHEQLFRDVAPGGELGERILSRRPLVTRTSVCTICIGAPEEGTFLTVMVPLRLAPWGVVIQQEEGKAFAVIRPSQAGLLASLLLVAVMVLLLSRGLARSVVGPIQQLSAQAEQLRQGDLETPVAVEGDREIQVLAKTLNEARSQLATVLGELTSVNEHLEELVADRTQVLVEQDAQRRVLVRRLLAAGEEERRRIARELHDEISQLLTVIQLSLEPMAEQAGGKLDRVKELLTRTQKEIHRIIYDLRPSLLDDLGLAAAVKWYAASYLEPAGLQVALEVEDDLALPAEVEITTFRIYQEIITNILRHARAESVSIELYARGGRLVLAVEDDGVGFDPGEKVAGAGLLGMRERASLVGGRLDVDSEPGMGAHVALEIPLEPEAAPELEQELDPGLDPERGAEPPPAAAEPAADGGGS